MENPKEKPHNPMVLPSRMVDHRGKELADDLAYLEIILEKILEMVEKGTVELKAADALKIIELKRKLVEEEKPSEDRLRGFLLEVLREAKQSARPDGPGEGVAPKGGENADAA